MGRFPACHLRGWLRREALALQPPETFVPAETHLLEGEPGFASNLFQGEAAKVMHVYHTRGVGVLGFQFLHEQADSHNSLCLIERCPDDRVALVERHGTRSLAAAQAEPLARHVGKQTPHREACQSVKMLPVLDSPAAFREPARPQFVNQFRSRERRRRALAAKSAESDLAKLRQNLPRQGVGRVSIAFHE